MNKKTTKERAQILNLLVEGNSLRATTRIIRDIQGGCSINTVTKLLSMRRFTRLTNAFSKKLDNHAHAIALHFMHYNFVRIHKSLKITPAMAAGASETLWSLEDVVKMTDDYWNEKNNSN